MGSNALAKNSEETRPELHWFVARGSLLKGPFSTDELQAKVKKKEISFLDYCWRQGFGEWRPIGSLEDFDRRGRMRALPEYPGIPVPGGLQKRDEESQATSGAPLQKFLSKPVKGQEHKTFEVTLARGKRHSITIYEWGLAAIFSIIFAFLSSNFALNEVKNVFEYRMNQMSAGLPVFVGLDDVEAVAADFWEPLFSAPSFSEVSQQGAFEKLDIFQHPLKLSVYVRGEMVLGPNGELNLGVYNLSHSHEWVKARFLAADLDSVYIRPRELRGYLHPRSPASIEIEGAGEPYLRE
jgi:hypothetical protein